MRACPCVGVCIYLCVVRACVSSRRQEKSKAEDDAAEVKYEEAKSAALAEAKAKILEAKRLKDEAERSAATAASQKVLPRAIFCFLSFLLSSSLLFWFEKEEG